MQLFTFYLLYITHTTYIITKTDIVCFKSSIKPTLKMPIATRKTAEIDDDVQTVIAYHLNLMRPPTSHFEVVKYNQNPFLQFEQTEITFSKSNKGSSNIFKKVT